MYPLVTLCGTHNFGKEWVKPCINSWHRLKNVDPRSWFLVPDQRLVEEDRGALQNLGFQIKDRQEDRLRIEATLANYPTLKLIRQKDLTWQKLLDTCILFNDYEQIVLIDTDVLITANCFLPEIDSDFVYMLEDIPAYRGKWGVTWQENMVPAFNAGLVIFKPTLVDLEYLEFFTKKYILNCKDYWWSEQLAWACLAGKTDKRFVFDGKQTRVVSGFLKRTPDQVKTNQFVYFGKRGQIQEFSVLKDYIDQSVIIHFAGLGKKWFQPSYEFLSQNNDENKHCKIEVYQDRLLSFKDKVCISSRLFIQELI